MSEPLSYIAGGNLADDAGLCMQVSATNTVTRATAATQVPAGILKYGVASGALAAVYGPGEKGVGRAGGVLTPGTHVYCTTNGSGRLITATAGQRIWAKFIGKEAAIDGSEIEIIAMDGSVADTDTVAAHLADAAGAHAASAISLAVADTNDWPGADPDDVKEALDLLAARVTDDEAHVTDAAGAHAGTAISYAVADTNDWPGADPTDTTGALDLLAERLTITEADGNLAHIRLAVSATAEGASTAQAFRVTIQLTDALGANLAAVRRLQLRTYRSTMIEAVVAAISITRITGSGVSADVNASMLLDTDATGLAVVDVLDVSGALVEDVFLEVEVVGITGGAAAPSNRARQFMTLAYT